MNTATTPAAMRERVDALWDHVEQHHALDADALNATMRALDDALIDVEPTNKAKLAALAKRIAATEKRIHDRDRAYRVDHATGRVPGYVHEDHDGTPRPYKPLHGDKHLKRVKGGWQVKITMFGETVTSLHRTKREAQMERDYLREYRTTEAQTRRSLTGSTADTSKQDAKARAIIEAAEATAEKRKAKLRDALKDNPGTPWSAVLRRPEFDTTGEPWKRDPR